MTKMPVSSLKISFEKSNMFECCNAECGWKGPEEKTVVFKHDKGRKDAPRFCPECREICEIVE